MYSSSFMVMWAAGVAPHAAVATLVATWCLGSASATIISGAVQQSGGRGTVLDDVLFSEDFQYVVPVPNTPQLTENKGSQTTPQTQYKGSQTTPQTQNQGSAKPQAPPTQNNGSAKPQAPPPGDTRAGSQPSWFDESWEMYMEFLDANGLEGISITKRQNNKFIKDLIDWWTGGRKKELPWSKSECTTALKTITGVLFGDGSVPDMPVAQQFHAAEKVTYKYILENLKTGKLYDWVKGKDAFWEVGRYFDSNMNSHVTNPKDVNIGTHKDPDSAWEVLQFMVVNLTGELQNKNEMNIKRTLVGVFLKLQDIVNHQ